jgi:hypothetical protein
MLRHEIVKQIVTRNLGKRGPFRRVTLRVRSVDRSPSRETRTPTFIRCTETNRRPRAAREHRRALYDASSSTVCIAMSGATPSHHPPNLDQRSRRSCDSARVRATRGCGTCDPSPRVRAATACARSCDPSLRVYVRPRASARSCNPSLRVFVATRACARSCDPRLRAFLRPEPARVPAVRGCACSCDPSLRAFVRPGRVFGPLRPAHAEDERAA